MTSWPSAHLGDVAKIDREGVDPSRITSGTLYIGLEHIKSGGRLLEVKSVSNGDLASTKFRFTQRHLLYGKLRPYLAKIALPGFDGVCSTDILPVLPGPSLDRSYLAHFLRQPEMIAFASSRSEGANLPRLSPRVLAGFDIPLPPIPEQERIATILDNADHLRVLRLRSINLLQRLGQAIFHDMFGDPATNPKGWLVSKLGDLIGANDRINYGVVQPGEGATDGVPLVRVADIMSPVIDVKKLKRIDRSIESNYSRSRLSGEEILVGCVGSIGAVYLADERLKGANIARAVGRVPIDPNKSNKFFVAELLRTDSVQRYFALETRIVAQPTLNIKQLAETPVLVPALDRQNEFAEKIAVVEAQKQALGRHFALLSDAFASLQYRAFRGEL